MKLFLSEPNFENDYDILVEEDEDIYVVAEHVNYEEGTKIVERYNYFEK